MRFAILLVVLVGFALSLKTAPVIQRRAVTATITSSSSAPCANTLTNSIIAWYRFEEGAATAKTNATAGVGQTLAIQGSVTSVAGIKGNGCGISGSGENYLYVTAPTAFAVSNPKFYAVWVKTGSNGYVFGSGVPTDVNKTHQLSLSVGGVFTYTVFDDFGGSVLVNSTNATLNTWNLVVCGISGDESYMSVNNSEYVTGSLMSFTPSFEDNDFNVGTYANRDASINGVIDEFAAWGKALSQDEVSCLYNGGVGRTYLNGVIQ